MWINVCMCVCLFTHLFYFLDNCSTEYHLSKNSTVHHVWVFCFEFTLKMIMGFKQCVHTRPEMFITVQYSSTSLSIWGSSFCSSKHKKTLNILCIIIIKDYWGHCKLYTHKNIHTYTCMHTCTSAHTHTHTHTHTFMQPHMQPRMHICTHTCSCTHRHMYTHNTHTHTCMHTYNMHAHMHARTHTHTHTVYWLWKYYSLLQFITLHFSHGVLWT